MDANFCTHCKAEGHNILHCREVVKFYGLPTIIGAVCTICNARGRHYTSHCPRVTGRELRSMILSGPDIVCRHCGRHGHQVPICWAFARRHNLPAPFWWRCHVCAAVGEHGADACGSFAAYSNGDYGRIVLFDVQLSKADESGEIVSIAAYSVGPKLDAFLFHHYVLPTGAIEANASKKHGLTKEGGFLRLNGTPVQATQCPHALQNFSDWLDSTICSFAILVFYDSNKMKARAFLRHLKLHAPQGLLERVASRVSLADARPFLETVLGKYKLEEVGDAYDEAVGGGKKLYTGKCQELSDLAALHDVLSMSHVRRFSFAPYVFDAWELAQAL